MLSESLPGKRHRREVERVEASLNRPVATRCRLEGPGCGPRVQRCCTGTIRDRSLQICWRVVSDELSRDARLSRNQLPVLCVSTCRRYNAHRARIIPNPLPKGHASCLLIRLRFAPCSSERAIGSASGYRRPPGGWIWLTTMRQMVRWRRASPGYGTSDDPRS